MHWNITECKCGLGECMGVGWGRWVRTEPKLLMATLQPKKANNLEIIKHSLRLEIDRRAPLSYSFSSVPFINSTEYLRTHWEEEKNKMQSTL